ncbi:hypothetical protein BGZ49_000621 [Haplosporangium sp. Z 27]|nr:hypothetical protein BGZ49_000621 [Haplosporangium sp. Z 27]
MDVPIRWNSTQVMLRRTLQLKAPMEVVHVALRTTQDESDHLKDMDTHWLKDEEWDNARLIVDALQLLEEATLMGKQTRAGAADSLRCSLHRELDKRIVDSESRMRPALFAVIKEKVRRELDILKSCNNAQVQRTQEQQSVTASCLKNSLLELVAMQDSSNTNTNVPREDEFERYFRNR